MLKTSSQQASNKDKVGSQTYFATSGGSKTASNNLNNAASASLKARKISANSDGQLVVGASVPFSSIMSSSGTPNSPPGALPQSKF